MARAIDIGIWPLLGPQECKSSGNGDHPRTSGDSLWLAENHMI